MRSISRFSYVASVWSTICNPVETYRQKKSAKRRQNTVKNICDLASKPTQTTQNLNQIISDFEASLDRPSSLAKPRTALLRKPPLHITRDLQDHIVTRLIHLADLDPLDTRDQLAAQLHIAPGQPGYDAILEFIDPDRITGKHLIMARLTGKTAHHPEINQSVTIMRKGLGLGILQGIIKMSRLPPESPDAHLSTIK